MKNRRWLAVVLAGAAGFASARIAARYASDLDQASTRHALLRQCASTSHGAVEFATLGDGEPLLVVHGAGGGYDQGLDFGVPLAARGIRVIAVSRFGYLGSSLPDDASPEAQADAFAALLDHLGIAGCAIAGASAGAPSAMQFALRHPKRCNALLLVVPAAYVPRPDDAPPLLTPATTEFVFNTALRSDFLFWSAIRIAPRALVKGVLATPPGVLDRVDADERARAELMLMRILPVSARREGLLNDARITSSLARYDLEHIMAPTLVTSVADDLFGTYDAARYTAEHIPNARFVGFPSGGHVWLGHRQEHEDRIVAFLRDVAGGGGSAGG